MARMMSSSYTQESSAKKWTKGISPPARQFIPACAGNATSRHLKAAQEDEEGERCGAPGNRPLDGHAEKGLHPIQKFI